MLDLERAQILNHIVLFNRINGESGQVNYLLMPTVHSNFIVISTTVAPTHLNPSLNVFSFKEKGLPNFLLEIKYLIKYWISSTWLLSQIIFLLWILKPQGDFTLTLSLSIWSSFAFRSMTDAVISHWVLRFYEWFLDFKKISNNSFKHQFSSSQPAFYRK